MVRPRSFDELADLLSDGSVVDWDEAEKNADRSERGWIKNLRLIGDIGRVARSEDPSLLLPDATHVDPDLSMKGGRVDPKSMTSAPLAAPTGKSESWGPLNLLEKVGSGSFGDVHRAWDPMLNRQVALKLMNWRAAELPDAGARVLEEARLLARVEHSGVVRIYGVEEIDGCLGIWMEFVEGTDLSSVILERGKFEPVEAARLAAELSSAIGAVHAANVVHKDIKAANVMVRKDGHAVLMDFGAGKKRKLREGESEQVVTGTPRYMAPETFRREPATPQSDLYSIGILLYHMVTGDFPVSGTVAEIIAAHESKSLKPLGERDPSLPAEFVAIVERATATRREDRFESAAALESALNEFAASESGLAPIVRAPISRRRFAAWGLAAAAVVTAIAVGVTQFAPVSPLEAEVRYTGVDNGQFIEFEPGNDIGSDTQIEVKVRLNHDAYVYVLNRDAEGATTLLYPLANSSAHQKLSAGREHIIPGEIDGQALRFGPFAPIEGDESFLLVASIEPLPKFDRAMETAQVARIDASSYDAIDVGDLAMTALNDDALPGEATRGVMGLQRANEDSRDVFAIAERFGGANADGTMVLHHMRLNNIGQ